MFLIRFMMFLPEWCDCRRVGKLSVKCWNDCVSKDGDLSFFGINCDYKKDFYHQEILDAISRQVFSNYSKWKEMIGAIFLKKKSVEHIKKGEFVNDECPVLSTKHYNISQVLDCHSRKFVRLFFKNRFESKIYDIDDIAKALDSVPTDQWKSLILLPNNPKEAAKKIINLYYKDRKDEAPEFLRNYIN